MHIKHTMSSCIVRVASYGTQGPRKTILTVLMKQESSASVNSSLACMISQELNNHTVQKSPLPFSGPGSESKIKNEKSTLNLSTNYALEGWSNSLHSRIIILCNICNVSKTLANRIPSFSTNEDYISKRLARKFNNKIGA